MRAPYIVQPEVHDGRGGYAPVGQASTFASVEDARGAVRRIAAETGVVPRVTDGSGKQVWLVACGEIGRLADGRA